MRLALREYMLFGIIFVLNVLIEEVQYETIGLCDLVNENFYERLRNTSSYITQNSTGSKSGAKETTCISYDLGVEHSRIAYAVRRYVGRTPSKSVHVTLARPKTHEHHMLLSRQGRHY